MSDIVDLWRQTLGSAGLPATQAHAILNLAVSAYNAAIEEAAKVAEAHVANETWTDHLLGREIAEEIRKLKRAP